MIQMIRKKKLKKFKYKKLTIILYFSKCTFFF